MHQKKLSNSEVEFIKNAIENYQKAAPVVEQSENDTRENLVETAQQLYQEGLLTSTGGNISALSKRSKTVWITPSQIPKGRLNMDMFVAIDLDGNKLGKNPYQPSSEKFIHTEIYKARPDVQTVIHAHAIFATALALCELPFLPISTESAIIKEIPRVGFIMPGTMKLAQAVVQAMGAQPAVLMQNHGVVVAASSIQKTTNILQVIERTSQLILTCYSAGIKPSALPAEVVNILHESLKIMA